MSTPLMKLKELALWISNAISLGAEFFGNCCCDLDRYSRIGSCNNNTNGGERGRFLAFPLRIGLFDMFCGKLIL